MYPKKSRKKVHIARRGVIYSLILCGVILLLGGAGFWLLDPGVHTFADGLWLAFTTAATVGYGDVVPSTHASRMFAVLVVLMGLAVLSLVTASLAAIFVEKDVEEGEERQIEHELMREIRHLREDVQHLRQEIAGDKTAQPVRVAPDADAK
jgi:voltage-gated potassium channel